MSIPSYGPDRTFPIFLASICLIVCAFLIIRMMLKPGPDTILADRDLNGDDAEATDGLWPTLACFAALLGLTPLLGFILALTVFLFAFMVIRAKVSMVFAAFYTAAGLAFMCAVAWLLHRDFPSRLLQKYFALP